MDDKVCTILEFPKIKEMLAHRTASPLGRAMAQDIQPSTEFTTVAARLSETEEALAVLSDHPDVPLSSIHDLVPLLRQAEVGATLAAEDLLTIAATMYAVRRLQRFMLEAGPRGQGILAGWAAALTPCPAVEKNIDAAIDEHGQIRDTASPTLLHIRQSMRRLERHIKEKLDELLHHSQYQRYFQDLLITIRQDRYVIPVKQEYRQNFPGIVHDQSASGATVFIEPMAVVNMNNEIKQLAVAEKHEIERILIDLSGQVAAVAGVMRENCRLLAQLDLAFAKGRLALDMNATAPQLNRQGYLHIRAGRHPLLRGEIVPVDIWLGDDFHTLVITGPNTGGKTVSLKTVGLFALMTQAGLYIPAEQGSEMPVFAQIFADIGDEQSIEQSLSTFSAHMTNLVHILTSVQAGDLVLIDEIGAGTDPEEGAALAMAILEYLHERDVRTIATTHYSELKTFAYTRQGMENASVEFDIQTLRPTYHLLIGVPGSSNALAITRRLGLEPAIIDRARQLMQRGHEELEQVLVALHAQQHAYREKNEQLLARERELAAQEEQLRRERERLTREREAQLARTRQEAKLLLSRLRQESRSLIDELKRQLQAADAAGKAAAIQQVRQRLRMLRADIANTEEDTSQEIPVGEVCTAVQPGERVFVVSLQQPGVVLAENREGEVAVQVGAVRVNVPLAGCRRLDGAKSVTHPSPKTSPTHLPVQQAVQVKRELDLRGMTVDEAAPVLDKYLDDALLAGLTEVVVIHGKGTGALRKGIREILREHPRVAGFRSGEAGEGGDGVTVVRVQ